MSERERLTPERLAELRRIAEAAAIIADADTEGTSGEQAASIMQYIATFDPPTVLAMLDRIEALEYMVSWYSSRRLSGLSRWGGNGR